MRIFLNKKNKYYQKKETNLKRNLVEFLDMKNTQYFITS